MKDSTLYIILCVIVAIFCIFLGCKMIFPPKTTEVVQKEEPIVENKVEELVNQIQEQPTNGTTISTNETTTKKTDNVFQTQIRGYEGKKRGSEVRNLLETIRNSNLVADKKIRVEFAGEDHTDDVYEIKRDVETGKTYEIILEYENESQNISKVIIR